MTRNRRFPALARSLFGLGLAAMLLLGAAAEGDAQGWTTTGGGRGGKIIRVTTLKASGPGSFLEALNTKGPRIVVFEVGGVIDLDGKTARITEPFLTIAGQTAPSPGVTFIRGGFWVGTHDVVIQHIRVRPGEAGKAKGSGWEADGLSTWAARDVVVDHSSFSWSTDENLSVSGPPFEGADPAAWRRNTSQRVTLSNNIIADGLHRSTHKKGPHGKGTLIHDNITDVLIQGNLYANNMDRNPRFKGGVWAAVVNNYIYNPGAGGRYDRTVEDTFRVVGRVAMVGNVLQYGPDTKKGLPLMHFSGPGDLELNLADNVARDLSGKPAPVLYGDPKAAGKIIDRPADFYLPPGLRPIPASRVEEEILRNVGARPWERDEIDRRIVEGVRTRTGHVIDSEREAGGYPVLRETRRPFDPAEWDLSTMTRL